MGWQNPSTLINAAPIYTQKNLHSTVNTVQNIAAITPVTITGTGESGCDISLWAGYEIQFQAQQATSVSAGINVTLKWYMNLTDTIPVDQIAWQQLPVGTSTAYQTQGHGPMRGLYMVVLIQNTNGVANTTYTLQISGTTRTYLNDDWRSNGWLPGLTAPGATAWTNELAIMFATSIPASGQVNQGIYMYTGRAFLHFDTQAGVGTLNLTITDWGQNNITGNYAPGEGKSQDEEIILPRGPCQLTVTNSGGSAAICDVMITADRV